MTTPQLIPIRRVFTHSQIVTAIRLFKKYGLSFTKKNLKIKRCDSVEVFKICNCVCLEDINSLLEKIESVYVKTKSMTTKESLDTVRKMKEDFLIGGRDEKNSFNASI